MKPLPLWVVLAAAVLAACESAPPLQTRDEPLKSVKRADYFVIVRYLDEPTLGQRYGGTRHNPFIARRRTITPSRFMVFRLNIEEVGRPLLLKLNQMELLMGNRHVAPMDQRSMNEYWEFEDLNQPIPQFDRDQRDRYVREELLPNEVSVPAGARLARLVVFCANFPSAGEAKLVIPLFDPRRELVERLEFTFTF